jgi:uncharacterized protein (TIGR02270 family)
MIIPEIISQHFEEASFLWLLRDRAVHSPHYRLADLAKLDRRVEAGIDGLRVAGDTGWQFCEEGLEQGDTGAVFVAAILAFESGHEERMQHLVAGAIATPQLSRGLVSALGWLPAESVLPFIDRMAVAGLPSVRRVGIAASAILRRDPGAPLTDALGDEDLSLRARAAKAVGELGRMDFLPQLQSALTASDVLVRYSAAWSGTLLGHDESIAALRAFAVPGNGHAEDAVRAAARRMELPIATGWQRELAQNQATMRLAILCAGAVGEPASIPWLVEQMGKPELARVAGESFAMITGADIANENMEDRKPEGFEAGPTDNPEDEDVAMDRDDDLPWPNVRLIKEWWDQRRDGFPEGTRFLMGKPVAEDHLRQVLKTGRQRQRAAAALELAMLKPGQPLFEVRSPGFLQQKLLGLPGR